MGAKPSLITGDLPERSARQPHNVGVTESKGGMFGAWGHVSTNSICTLPAVQSHLHKTTFAWRMLNCVFDRGWLDACVLLMTNL